MAVRSMAARTSSRKHGLADNAKAPCGNIAAAADAQGGGTHLSGHSTDSFANTRSMSSYGLQGLYQSQDHPQYFVSSTLRDHSSGAADSTPSGSSDNNEPTDRQGHIPASERMRLHQERLQAHLIRENERQAVYNRHGMCGRPCDFCVENFSDHDEVSGMYLKMPCVRQQGHRPGPHMCARCRRFAVRKAKRRRQEFPDDPEEDPSEDSWHPRLGWQDSR